MANLMLKDGKVLVKDGKVATDPRCCCCLGKWGREFVITISGPVACACASVAAGSLYVVDLVLPPTWPVVYQEEWDHYFTGPTWVSEFAGSGQSWTFSFHDCETAELFTTESFRVEAQCVAPNDTRMHAVLYSIGDNAGVGHGPIFAFEAFFDQPGDEQESSLVCGTDLIAGGFGSV